MGGGGGARAPTQIVVFLLGFALQKPPKRRGNSPTGRIHGESMPSHVSSARSWREASAASASEHPSKLGSPLSNLPPYFLVNSLNKYLHQIITAKRQINNKEKANKRRKRAYMGHWSSPDQELFNLMVAFY